MWTIPLPHTEIRSIFINWPVKYGKRLSAPTSSSSSNPYVEQNPFHEYHEYQCGRMQIKHCPRFDDFNVEDFGVRAGDADMHVLALYIVKKSPNMTHKDLHMRSDAGKKRDAERRKMKRQAKRRKLNEAQDAGDDDDVDNEDP